MIFLDVQVKNVQVPGETRQQILAVPKANAKLVLH